jgi:hypothetical protein
MTKLKGLFFSLGAVDVLLYAFVGLAIWSLAVDVNPVAEIKGWMTTQLRPSTDDSAASFVVEVSP